MDVADTELIALLERRDGPLPERSWAHDSEHCRYAELYEGQPCPWCAAEQRRREREAGGEVRTHE